MGWGGTSRAVLSLAEGDLRAAWALPCEELGAFPLGFPPDLDDGEGVLRGIGAKSIAQMVCFSFAVTLLNQEVLRTTS